MRGTANPFGKPHAGSNPALASKIFLLANAAFFATICKINSTKIVQTSSSAVATKVSRSQQRTRSEILMRAIANENVFLVEKLISEGTTIPSKYDGMDVETFIFQNFNPQIAQALKPLKRKWDFSKIGTILQSPPTQIRTHALQWSQFIVEMSASSSLQSILNSILVRWKKLDPAVTAVLCQQLVSHANTADWVTHIMKTNSSRAAALRSSVCLQSQPIWDALKNHWMSADFVKFSEDVARGVHLTPEEVVFLKKQVDDDTIQKKWDVAEKTLLRNYKKFESFYRKTFGTFETVSDFIASHTALRWQKLPQSLKPEAFNSLGLPWWRSVQAQGRAVVKSTLGNDVPSNSPRSFEHALLLDPDFRVFPAVSDSIAAELHTGFDAYALCLQHPSQLKKLISDFPSIRVWKDEYGNTLGHYMAAFTTLNKSLIGTMVKYCPHWFEQTNANGASPVSILAVVRPESPEASQISQALLQKATKKRATKAPSATRKI